MSTPIAKQVAVAPSPGGGFARAAGSEQTQPRARKHQPHFLREVLGESRVVLPHVQ